MAENYRPVNNLPFMSKVVVKNTCCDSSLVTGVLINYSLTINQCIKQTSVWKQLLVKLQNDILWSMEKTTYHSHYCHRSECGIRQSRSQHAIRRPEQSIWGIAHSS